MKGRHALSAVATALALFSDSTAWAIAWIPPYAEPRMLEPLSFEIDAARNGKVSVQMRLGEWYSEGPDDEKNSRKAAYWFLKAASAGNVRAQQYVIEDYEFGRGFPRSHAKALEWYQRATVRDSYDAAESLVGIYEREANTRKAAEWIRIGARGGSPWCQYRLADAYHSGKSPFTKDFARAMTWYVRVADKYPGYSDWRSKNTTVEYAIGEMFELGEGVTQSYEKALRWYVLAASRKDNMTPRDAEYTLGELYAKGLGAAQDYRVASVWYQRAADHGSAYAGIKVADLYERGLGVSQSDRLAMYSYFKVTTRNDTDGVSTVNRRAARERLFAIFERGAAVPQDDGAAIQWYREHASKGDMFARRGLALCYEVGYRVERNEGVAAAIERELERSDESSDTDYLREWIPKWVGYLPRDFNNLLARIHEPGQFLNAIDDFAAHARLMPPIISD
jgi:TPR repeat protein